MIVATSSNCHYHAMLATLRRLPRTRDIYEDLAQDAFRRCWNHERKTNSLVSEEYAIATAKNCYRSWVRTERLQRLCAKDIVSQLCTKKRCGNPLDARERLGEASEENDPSFLFEKAEVDALVPLLIESLPPKLRDVVKLHTFDGLTFSRISKVIGRSLRTVKRHYKSAKRMIETQVKRILGG